jgi:isochorismate synthase
MREVANYSAVAFVRYPKSEIKAFSSVGTIVAFDELPKDQPGFIYAPFDITEGIAFLTPENNHHAVKQFLEKCEADSVENTVLFGTSKEEYVNAASTLLAEIQKGNLQKVILSRIVSESINPDNSAFTFFQKLCDTYPDACVHIFAHSEKGIWIGATPELLLKVEQNELRTVSLAGTKKRNSKLEAIISWQEKETDEQAMVSSYIANILNGEKGLENIQQSAIKTVAAGNVFHLKSDFTATTNSFFNWTELVQKLHPTPAVCGLPLNASKAAILKNEKHNREFYTGFFGICGPDSIQLHVNLRCLKWHKNRVQIFVGGGLTNQSIVEDEWEETNDKSLTLLNVLNKL